MLTKITKKGDWDMGFIAKTAFVLFAFMVILFVIFGPNQLFAKSSDPLGNTAGGLSSDCDNDGTINTLDSCPCDPNKDPEPGKGCATPLTECNKRQTTMRKDSNKKDCLS